MDGSINPIGDWIADKYVVDRVIGRGGMGTVLLAHHHELLTPVAIKVLLSGAAHRADSVTRFVREARAAARIRSDHVARVHDVGKLASGEPFMVMDYLEGHDLSAELDERVALPLQESVDWLLQAMEAVSQAHRLGIVHRDLKPANLFLAEQADGSRLVKVLDFGISKMASETEASITASASMLGSPLYMAPEQIRNARTVDQRADIWSLGVILYECLAGVQPFSGVGSSGVLATVVADPHVAVDVRRDDVPLDLSRTVDACLAKDPGDRIQTTADLAERLARFASPRMQRYVARIANISQAELGSPVSSGTRPSEEVLAAQEIGWHPPDVELEQEEQGDTKPAGSPADFSGQEKQSAELADAPPASSSATSHEAPAGGNTTGGNTPAGKARETFAQDQDSAGDTLASEPPPAPRSGRASQAHPSFEDRASTPSRTSESPFAHSIRPASPRRSVLSKRSAITALLAAAAALGGWHLRPAQIDAGKGRPSQAGVVERARLESLAVPKPERLESLAVPKPEPPIDKPLAGKAAGADAVPTDAVPTHAVPGERTIQAIPATRGQGVQPARAENSDSGQAKTVPNTPLKKASAGEKPLARPLSPSAHSTSGVGAPSEALNEQPLAGTQAGPDADTESGSADGPELAPPDPLMGRH